MILQLILHSMIVFAAICPHPPAIIPGLKDSEKGRLKKTIRAMEELSEEFKESQPETVIVISPHGPMRYDKFTINLETRLRGDFSDFGAEKETLDFSNDITLGKDIFSNARKQHLPIEILRESKLDYGTLIPLSYLTADLENKPKLVPLTYTAFNWEMHYNFGKMLGQTIIESERSIALVASGDLSHRLSENSPAGFSPYGDKFDKTLIELLEKNDPKKVASLNPEFCDEASECGLRSILVLLGALDNRRSVFRQLSYESPLGVGYLVGKWKLK